MTQSEIKRLGITNAKHWEHYTCKLGELPEELLTYADSSVEEGNMDLSEIDEETNVFLHVPVGSYPLSYEDLKNYPAWRLGVRIQLKERQDSLVLDDTQKETPFVALACQLGLEEELSDFSIHGDFSLEVDGYKQVFVFPFVIRRLLEEPNLNSLRHFQYWALRHQINDHWYARASKILIESTPVELAS